VSGGFLRGVVWGGVVAVAALGVVSQIAPPPAGLTAALSVPETDAVVPEPTPLPKARETEAQPEILQKVPETVAEEEPSVDVAPEAADPAPPAGPATTAPPAGNRPAPAEAATQPADETAAAAQVPEPAKEMPVLQPPLPVDTTAPDAPDGTGLQAEAGVPAPAPQETRPGVAVPDGLASPPAETAPPMVEAPPAAPVEEALLQPAPPAVPRTAPAIVVPQEPVPQAEEPANQPGLAPDEGIALAVPGVRTDRLPRIGDEAEVVPESAPEELAVLGTTPLELFARTFDNPAGKPLFSIILIDEGTPPEDRATLAALPFPVTFALDPLREDSAEASRVYREAGQEVAMLASGIPDGATVGDLEQTFQTLDLALPEAVVVLDRPEGGLQDAADLSRAIVPIVAEQGRGLLTYDRGLNPADQVARREGVPAAVIFRILDSEGESIPRMRNYLDRAAFKAAQEGSVVVIGRTRPETVAAILEWTVEGRAAAVALAPVSAVLEAEPTP